MDKRTQVLACDLQGPYPVYKWAGSYQEFMEYQSSSEKPPQYEWRLMCPNADKHGNPLFGLMLNSPPKVEDMYVQLFTISAVLCKRGEETFVCKQCNKTHSPDDMHYDIIHVID